jgi:hypothetical protein
MLRTISVEYSRWIAFLSLTAALGFHLKLFGNTHCENSSNNYHQMLSDSDEVDGFTYEPESSFEAVLD